MSKQPLRIGQINFTNILPIYRFFPYERWDDNEIEMIPQVPTQLNQSMLDGQIDIGPISSFAYGLNPERYLLYPNLSVSSLGRVGSIFLFMKRPLDAVVNGTVALPSTSASSVALLRVILEAFHGGQPTYQTFAPNLDVMLEKCDAALLIGDDALLARRHYPKYSFMDLGEEWYRLTGHYMTYAVWAIRREIAAALPEQTDRLYQSFLYSKQQGQIRPTEVIQTAIQRFGGMPDFWEEYYRLLNFDFAGLHYDGLEYFYDQAYRLNLLPQPTKISLWEPRTANPQPM
jgi:chorismate dehydratase